MQLTRKIRIYPTEEQAAVLWDLSDINRRLYNRALNERRDAYATGTKGVTYIKQQNDLPELKKEWPELKKVNAKVLQMTLKTLDANDRSFFELIKVDPDTKPPGFKGRKYFTTMKHNQSGFKIDTDSIKLSHKLPGGVDLIFAIPEHEFGVVKQVEVFQDGKEKWYLAVVEEVVPPTPVDNGQYQAWDLGVIKQTAVNSQGKFIEVQNIRPDRYWNKKIDTVQSKRDHCKKIKGKQPSRRWKRYNAVKRKMEKKKSNQLKDFQHKVSKKLVENTKAGTIIIGDLPVKKMPRSKTATKPMNRSTQGTGYLARFAGFLTYKAILAGKQVIEIGEEYTSKTCCCCGKIHPEMTVKDRVMQCDCGSVFDRDRNAAVNIMLRCLSQNALWTGYQEFTGNLRHTGLKIASIPGHSQEAPCASGG
ncbi:transposase [Methanocalculus sp.]|uniref:RNA-guided endonuclease InsQ/TnpB family protein n=1 Tax=Methanocalculus sp. TaxID=2004547 RepID=UPI0026150466|nr:transposase [Methanocalculus sp.]MDG6251516.1 transposase [Methanocalculus sp.]